MKTKKKNRFLTFCFSLLPGAGEMYMGFMKMGVSLMSLFFVSFFSAAYIGAVFGCITAIIWFYGFFHANHLAGMSDPDFEQVKDQYLFGIEELNSGKDTVVKYQKWVAIGLIILGVFFLWNVLFGWLIDIVSTVSAPLTEALWSINDGIPRIFIGLLIIFVGVKLISGKKAELYQEQTASKAVTPEVTASEQEASEVVSEQASIEVISQDVTETEAVDHMGEQSNL